MLNVKSADAFFIHFYDDGNGKDVNKRTVRMVKNIALMKAGIILAYLSKDCVFLNYRKDLIAYYETVDYTEYADYFLNRQIEWIMKVEELRFVICKL